MDYIIAMIELNEYYFKSGMIKDFKLIVDNKLGSNGIEKLELVLVRVNYLNDNYLKFSNFLEREIRFMELFNLPHEKIVNNNYIKYVITLNEQKSLFDIETEGMNKSQMIDYCLDNRLFDKIKELN